MEYKPLILIVEDNIDNKELLEYFLKHSNFKVISVTNGIDAVHFINKYEIDLILLDIMLPKKNGFEVARELKESSYANIPIVAISALAMNGDKERILKSGCDDYLCKPIDLYILLKKINSILNVNNQLSING